MKTVPQLYAESLGKYCEGSEKCYWCSAPCNRKWLHGNGPNLPFRQYKEPVNCVASSHICIGCWLFRRPRVTIDFLNDEREDFRSPRHQSWIITESWHKAINKNCIDKVYNFLLNPELPFALLLIDEAEHNYAQSGVVNLEQELKDTTNLSYSLDGHVHTYTIYELQEALQNGPEGKEPGVQTLLRVLKTPTPAIDLTSLEDIEEPEVRGRGRPKNKNTQKKPGQVITSK